MIGIVFNDEQLNLMDNLLKEEYQSLMETITSEQTQSKDSQHRIERAFLKLERGIELLGSKNN